MLRKFIILLTLTAVFAACQSIPENERLIAVDPSEISLQHGVLLTEFTGIRCSNCPKAAEEAHRLTESLGANLVVVAMHPASNGFTKPVSDCDYTCPEADIYYKHLGGTSTTSFPTGTVGFAPSFAYFTDWAALVIREGIVATEVSIDLAATRSERNIQAEITVSNTEKSARAVRVLLWLVENDIVGFQTLPDGSKDKEYHHQHMLRSELFTAKLPAEDEQKAWGSYLSLKGTQTLSCEGTIAETVNPENCCLVAVVMDDATRTILNVKQVKL